jgi:large subunit ribosomal protein L25
MSQRSTLQVAPRKRSGTGALKRLRREGLVPAVVYGKKFDNINLKVNAKEIRDLLARSTSEHILVDLQIEGAGQQLALIQDVTHNPLSGNIVHIDFHAIKEDEKIHARVPVRLTGESAGVKLGGLLEQQIHTLEISCLPKDLPEAIVYDVSHLNTGDFVHINELPFPEGVQPKLSGDVIAIHIAAPRVSAEPVAAPAAEKAATKTATKAAATKQAPKK